MAEQVEFTEFDAQCARCGIEMGARMVPSAVVRVFEGEPRFVCTLCIWDAVDEAEIALVEAAYRALGGAWHATTVGIEQEEVA